MADRINGVVMTVKFFNAKPGFGKLKNEQFKEVFIHKSYIQDCGDVYTSDGDKLLVPGQQVRCDLIPNPKKPNGMMAINLRVCAPETVQQIIEEDLRGDVLSFDPARQSGVISNRLYGQVDFKAQDFDGPAHRLTERPIVAFDLARRQAVKMAVNIRALGEGASAAVSMIERGVLGEVVRLQKTFGFIKSGSRDAFFHLSEIKGGEIVRMHQIVRFDLTPGTKGPGSFAAINISIVSGAVSRPVPRAPGSISNRSRKSVPKEKVQPPKVGPDWKAGERPARDFKGSEPDLTLQSPQRRAGERPVRDFEGSEPDLALQSPQRRAGERPARGFEGPEFDLALPSPQRRAGERPVTDFERVRVVPQQRTYQTAESNERVNQILEDQRKVVAQHSLARNVRPDRLKSPERPFRGTEAEVLPRRQQNDLPPQVHPVAPILIDSRSRVEAVRTRPVTSNPQLGPAHPLTHHNPQRWSPLEPVNPNTNALFASPPRGAGFDILPSRDQLRARPTQQLPAPVLSGFRRVAAVRDKDRDSDSSDSSDEIDVRPDRTRRPSPSPPPRQRPLNPSYVSQRDPTRPDEIRECRICDGIVKWPLKTPCGHLFCRACVERWLKFQPTCPLSSCQKDLKLEQLQPGV